MISVGVLVVDVADPPFSWSPSGKWVAFTVATPPPEQALALFPLFPDQANDHEHGTASSVAERAGLIYRIWAVRVEDGQAVKVAESDCPMTSPSWGPDGRALAFARLVDSDSGSASRWEVVVAHGEEHEVIASRPLEYGASCSETLISETVAWDPRGGLLAVPDPERLGIDLIEIEHGTRIRRIEDARFLSFSPLGDRLAYYRLQGGRWELTKGSLDRRTETDQPIDLVPRISQAPLWTSDGRMVLYLKSGSPNTEGIQVRLFGHQLDQEGSREIKEVESPAMPGEQILGSYMSIATDGLDQFFVVQYSGRQATIAYHQGSHPLDRIHPFSGLGMLGAVSLSPRGDSIAVRFGGPGVLSIPGLITLATKQLTPFAPDDGLKAAWVVALARAAEGTSDFRSRPTRLPTVVEFGELGPSPTTYKRLAEIGIQLTNDLEQRGVSRSFTVRPSVFFSYLQGDYEAAERILGEVMDTASSPDQAERLLGLRAQLCLAQKKDREAGDILEFLRRQHRGPDNRIELDGTGRYSVTRDAPDAPSWPEALWELHRERLEPDAVDRAEPPALPRHDSPSPFDAPIPSRADELDLNPDRTSSR